MQNTHYTQPSLHILMWQFGYILHRPRKNIIGIDIPFGGFPFPSSSCWQLPGTLELRDLYQSQSYSKTTFILIPTVKVRKKIKIIKNSLWKYTMIVRKINISFDFVFRIIVHISTVPSDPFGSLKHSDKWYKVEGSFMISVISTFKCFNMCDA